MNTVSSRAADVQLSMFAEGERLRPDLQKRVNEASLFARQQLGTAPWGAENGNWSPVSVRTVRGPRGQRGVQLTWNQSHNSTPRLSTPLKLLSGLLSGIAVPLLSFLVGRESVANELAAHDLGRVQRFVRYDLGRYKEAQTLDYRFESLEKVAHLHKGLLENYKEHCDRAFGAKVWMAVGAAFAAITATFSGVLVYGAIAGGLPFAVGSCLAWAEWGYQSGKEQLIKQQAEELLYHARVLDRQPPTVELETPRLPDGPCLASAPVEPGSVTFMYQPVR